MSLLLMNPAELPGLTVTLCPRPGGGTRMCLVGELDIAGVDQVERALVEARAAGPVLVDLSRLDFMDCAGVGLFLRAQHRDPLLRLASPSPVVRRLFQLTRFVPARGFCEDPA